MARSGSVVTTSTTASGFAATTGAVFVTSAVAAVWLCRSMSQSMPMPGGWSMSMAWMRMPGQTWPGAAAMFAGMWTLMMIPMMLPAILPVLWQQRRYAPVIATAYFAVWTAIGIALYPVGIALALAEMRSGALSRAVPVATGVAVLLAGCIQMTRWKVRELACCRGCEIVPDGRRAWTYGLRAGVRCAFCCSGFMLAFVVVGVMNLAAMAVAAAAIAIERVAPRPDLTARAAGVALIAFGTVLVIRAV